MSVLFAPVRVRISFLGIRILDFCLGASAVSRKKAIDCLMFITSAFLNL